MPALVLTGAPGTDYAGEPIATATVNLAPQDHDLPAGCVWIKGWSENTGMANALFKANIISPVLGRARTGFCEATIHMLIRPPI